MEGIFLCGQLIPLAVYYGNRKGTPPAVQKAAGIFFAQGTLLSLSCQPLLDRATVPAGGALMGGDQPHFNDLMIEAHRVTFALDGVTKQDGPKALAVAVSNGRSIHAQLLDYQRTARMTKPESATLQNAIDLLQARLKFFGQSV
jgi:hypothetical protein